MTKSAWRRKNESIGKKALKAFKYLRQGLKRIPAKNQQFRETILDLVDYSIGQLTKMVGPDGQSPQTVALICRNLLEIDIITKYCLASPANFRNTMDDVWIDGKQVFEYLRKWVEYKSPGKSLAALDVTIANFDAKIKTAGIVRTKPLDLRTLAKTTGMEQEFDVLNKITSKLVHATALSIWAYEDKAEMQLLIDFMLQSTVRYSADVYKQIKNHVAKIGMEP